MLKNELNKNKYTVTKSDGSPVDPKAEYFLLRIDKDPLARIVLRQYAKLEHQRAVANYLEPRLAHDIRQWLVDTLDTPGGKAEYELQVRLTVEGKAYE